MIDLSVVVVSFNTRDVLATTIEAVLADAAPLRTEIIVVDNASHDGSAGMVRARFPQVHVVANTTNRFYTGGNNQGISLGRGRYVLVLNSDARPEPGTLAPMVAYLDAHPDVGALSPRLCFADGRVQRNCSRLRTYRQFLLEATPLGLVLRRMRRRVVDDAWYGDWDRLTERDVEVLPGSCIMVRRRTLEETGAFDERFRLYFAEDDWCHRIAAAGWRVRHAPIGTIIHPERASVRQVTALARRIYFDDMERYVAKHFGHGRSAILRLLARPWKWAHDMADRWYAR